MHSYRNNCMFLFSFPMKRQKSSDVEMKIKFTHESCFYCCQLCPNTFAHTQKGLNCSFDISDFILTSFLTPSVCIPNVPWSPDRSRSGCPLCCPCYCAASLLLPQLTKSSFIPQLALPHTVPT